MAKENKTKAKTKLINERKSGKELKIKTVLNLTQVESLKGQGKKVKVCKGTRQNRRVSLRESQLSKKQGKTKLMLKQPKPIPLHFLPKD